ncbi:hypothetical protein BP5796_12203 [Coleophoma crateriformis]|uniref:Uncharacterized protein n=1 Tax=Coleophoma crateriformis TaxID=565419 RepID=A0A3D8Q8V7_9HELO|nr:hypothetical protein BP5796_12203 [Coleophoma crateriformis]
MVTVDDSSLCNDISLHKDDPDIAGRHYCFDAKVQTTFSSKSHADHMHGAGPGVLAAFMLSSILTLLLSVFTLALQHFEHLNRTNWITQRLKHYSPDPKNPLGFWIEQLELFVLALSDQQLLTGLLLLVCAYGKYWSFSLRCGGNNMWHAVDVVCFSSLTHAATLLTLRSYFRRHRILAAIRVLFMYIIYILLLVALVHILKPDHKVNDRPKLASPMAKFWHGASYIEIIGILVLYLATYLPIFLSKEAMKVRICLAMNANELPAALAAWKPYQRRKDMWFREYIRASWFNVYKVIRSRLTKFAVIFCQYYVNAGCVPVLGYAGAVTYYVAFGLGFMGLKVVKNNLTTNWSFGQLLPVFVVLLPFHTLIGSIAGECRSIVCLSGQRLIVLDARQQRITDEEKDDGANSMVFVLPINTPATPSTSEDQSRDYSLPSNA